MLSSTIATFLAIAAADVVLGQSFSRCNPQLRDGCPPDSAFGIQQASCDLVQGTCGVFTPSAGTTTITHGVSGAAFKIEEQRDAPTIETPKYIFFGKFEVHIQAAPGAGIVTSAVLQSDDLDEIDWEFIGSDNARVQTNYFSKGNTSTYDRGKFHAVSNPTGSAHRYTIEWTKTHLVWSIDGEPVRTLLAKDCKAGTSSGFPQTPMQIKLGTWVAGKPGSAQGTIDWAGGYADWSKKPFVAYYKSVTITDYAGGDGPGRAATQYVYVNKTGTWESIQVQ
ncbi:glycoside hydrolase family 16 protein [Metarhizium robertsii]|uniref:Glycoside hydrolase family 16 protein n=3 Tax=Metarhizium TaxID=5529 RepID=E9EZV5_METRA|nr:glycoside hydrolase family 16 protein [Metarhizium robertsii ARSEF 23]ABC65826.1 cell wall glucanosyltransferase Mwg2 [Metarhizium anisopliae]EFY99496.1 glycoside hydrolase family 16 protein [Metarhizium robertsii ARSEF 23]EXV04459.1 glycoside hydrolase family 16 protein [Metarhizium robertsii]